jgi:hypothetical protein
MLSLFLTLPVYPDVDIACPCYQTEYSKTAEQRDATGQSLFNETVDRVLVCVDESLSSSS